MVKKFDRIWRISAIWGNVSKTEYNIIDVGAAEGWLESAECVI